MSLIIHYITNYIRYKRAIHTPLVFVAIIRPFIRSLEPVEPAAPTTQPNTEKCQDRLADGATRTSRHPILTRMVHFLGPKLAGEKNVLCVPCVAARTDAHGNGRVGRLVLSCVVSCPWYCHCDVSVLSSAQWWLVPCSLSFLVPCLSCAILPCLSLPVPFPVLAGGSGATGAQAKVVIIFGMDEKRCYCDCV